MPASSFPPSIKELIDEFEEIEDWSERYDYLIDLGKQLPTLAEELQTADHVVKGCMSTVWLVTQFQGSGLKSIIEIQADSDSLIVKGLIVVLLSLFQSRTPAEILQQNEDAVFGRLGLNQHLSPQRRNGLFAMVKRLKQLALEHASKNGNAGSA